MHGGGDHAISRHPRQVSDIVVNPDMPDRLVWRWTASGQYSASYVYAAMFFGQASILGAKEVWKTRSPRKCVFFLWLANLGRCWTSKRLQRQGLNEDAVLAHFVLRRMKRSTTY
jgi:hypothetical protein